MRGVRAVGSLVIMLLLNTPALGTNMYKWTDEKGNVHYTQQPPSGDIDAIKIGPPADVNTDKAQRQFEQKENRAERMEEQRQQAEAEQQQKEERAALYEKNCRLARDRLQKLENSGMVRAVDSEGNMTRISVEEHEARIAEVREKVKKYCEN